MLAVAAAVFSDIIRLRCIKEYVRRAGDENGDDTGNARWRSGEALPDPHEIEIDRALI
jgi:hypothetical protein